MALGFCLPYSGAISVFWNPPGEGSALSRAGGTQHGGQPGDGGLRPQGAPGFLLCPRRPGNWPHGWVQAAPALPSAVGLLDEGPSLSPQCCVNNYRHSCHTQSSIFMLSAPAPLRNPSPPPPPRQPYREAPPKSGTGISETWGRCQRGSSQRARARCPRGSPPPHKPGTAEAAGRPDVRKGHSGGRGGHPPRKALAMAKPNPLRGKRPQGTDRPGWQPGALPSGSTHVGSAAPAHLQKRGAGALTQIFYWALN